MRVGRGVLTVIALCCAASGAMRLGFGVGAALALGPEQTVAEDATCTETPLAVAEALTRREARVSEREASLNERLAALALAEKAITARMTELDEARKGLMQVVDVADGAAEDDLARLTAVYEAMKPADAARVFAAMSPDFAAGFLGRMRPETAATVLAALDPKLAFELTAMVAGRNAKAPTE